MINKLLPDKVYSLISVFSLVILLLVQYPAFGQTGTKSFAFEKADRGLIAVVTDNKQVYLGWRLLNNDPANVGFNIYRITAGAKAVKINAEPITGSTNFTDSNAPMGQPNEWYVTPVVNNKELTASEKTSLAANAVPQPYKSFKLQGNYSPNKVGIADLNGDGVYDLIIKQPSGSVDPGTFRRSQDTYKFEAYDGKTGNFMWRHDLGWNMDMGIWFTPSIVFDLDGDGKAEVAMKSSSYAATLESSFAEDSSFIMKGPEYCSILDGETGKEIDKVDWISRGNDKGIEWGDPRGNRVNRNLIGVAYLDGKRPSLLVCRGTYTVMRIDAYNLVNKKLQKVWSWSGDNETPKVQGQGFHGMHVYDVDNDGKDEILLGDAVLDDNGKILWNMNMGHPDICYLADIDYDRPGLEIFYAFERAQKQNGICVVDPATGKIIWGMDIPITHLHDWGMIGDIIPTEPGMELFAMEKDKSKSFLYNSKGKLLSDGKELGGGNTARAFYWKDGQIKVYYPFSYRATGNPIMEYKGNKLGDIPGQIVAIADVLGDWREEIITALDGEVRIYTTTIPSTSRRVNLMQDPLYRKYVAMVSMGYFYPPQLGRSW
ncbi:MAG TPA: silent information regulator protein Sir2 [Bacteroidales bacterium]